MAVDRPTRSAHPCPHSRSGGEYGHYSTESKKSSQRSPRWPAQPWRPAASGRSDTSTRGYRSRPAGRPGTRARRMRGIEATAQAKPDIEIGVVEQSVCQGQPGEDRDLVGKLKLEIKERFGVNHARRACRFRANCVLRSVTSARGWTALKCRPAVGRVPTRQLAEIQRRHIRSHDRRLRWTHSRQPKGALHRAPRVCGQTLTRAREKSSSRSPASRTMPPIVNALTGLCRGIVMIRIPSVITMCLPAGRPESPLSAGPGRRPDG